MTAGPPPTHRDARSTSVAIGHFSTSGRLRQPASRAGDDKRWSVWTMIGQRPIETSGPGSFHDQFAKAADVSALTTRTDLKTRAALRGSPPTIPGTRAAKTAIHCT